VHDALQPRVAHQELVARRHEAEVARLAPRRVAVVRVRAEADCNFICLSEILKNGICTSPSGLFRSPIANIQKNQIIFTTYRLSFYLTIKCTISLNQHHEFIIYLYFFQEQEEGGEEEDKN
jgi:hypothetical protein